MDTLYGCRRVRFISASSLQELCFVIRPSSMENDKKQKTTLKARDRISGQLGRGVLVMEAGAGIYHTDQRLQIS